MTMIPQLTRRREAALRLPPLHEPDERMNRLSPRPPLKPETALVMALSSTPFSLTLDDLRRAWQVASDEHRPYIEARAAALKETAA